MGHNQLKHTTDRKVYIAEIKKSDAFVLFLFLFSSSYEAEKALLSAET